VSGHPSSRQSSERFFTPHELLSSPVEWSMDTTAVNKDLLFNQGMESSSLVTEMPPRFINPICDMETPEGATIIFECSLMGTPSPVVSWFKGDKKIPHNDKKYLHSSEGDNHFLKICTVTTQDSGVYICRAINVVGETLCRASLVVVNAKSFSGRTRGREFDSEDTVETCFVHLCLEMNQ
uniref:Ig-like domain-containing protein n=1 Tax=Takifugu rubripes TaxID=31033 RepID=A0A674NND7_TAKRU